MFIYLDNARPWSFAVIELLDISNNKTFLGIQQLLQLIMMNIFLQFHFLPHLQLKFPIQNLQQSPTFFFLMRNIIQIQSIIRLQTNNRQSINTKLNNLIIILSNHLINTNNFSTYFIQSIQYWWLLFQL